MPRYPETATARLQAARSNRLKLIDEKLRLVALLSRVWPSHLSQTAGKDANWKHVVCVHSPAGQLAWKLTDDELPLFAHLKLTANDWDGHRADDKVARIDTMIADGWPDSY